jgi:two-component system, OmpR family, sensor histidine kinase KdpD
MNPRPEKFLDLIRASQRGRLKVYLGFAPGVGKTYEMLQEGQRLKARGVDVVAGIVETHGRADTAAQVSGLELVPRLRTEYRGVTLEELDLARLLERKPEVCLVDELAHTNAPGSRNDKRYQDVEELRRAGIHVISTMNIQHLESLYDIIEQFTGVKVKERVPDHVLAEADEIVNVDVTEADLQERLRLGKVYPAERAKAALENFFTAPNLNRLRELALEELATALDRKRQTQADTMANASDRLMVCLSSGSPGVHRLLRKTARIADRLKAPWFAVYVRTPKERIETTDAATQRRINEALTLARQLGGTSFIFNGPTFEAAVATFVEEYHITHIVLGRSLRPWYARWFGPSPLERLLSVVPMLDVTIVDTTPTAVQS